MLYPPPSLPGEFHAEAPEKGHWSIFPHPTSRRWTSPHGMKVVHLFSAFWSRNFFLSWSGYTSINQRRSLGIFVGLLWSPEQFWGERWVEATSKVVISFFGSKWHKIIWFIIVTAELYAQHLWALSMYKCRPPRFSDAHWDTLDRQGSVNLSNETNLTLPSAAYSWSSRKWTIVHAHCKGSLDIGLLLS